MTAPQPHGMLMSVNAIPCVVTAMWVAAGRPEPNWQGKARTTRPTPIPRQGICALLGTMGPVFDARDVVSALFTQWDRFRFRDPAGLAFSPPAAWALRHRVAMQRPHGLIHGEFSLLTPADLHQALRILPDDPYSAVSVPVSGQKHLLPWARWGRVIIDNHCLSWDAGDVAALGTYTVLRQMGYGEAALTEPAPRWAILTRQARVDQRWALLRWSDLARWRSTHGYLDVAARATRTAKETEPLNG